MVRIWGVEFQASGLGLRVWGLRLRVFSAEVWVPRQSSAPHVSHRGCDLVNCSDDWVRITMNRPVLTHHIPGPRCPDT